MKVYIVMSSYCLEGWVFERVFSKECDASLFVEGEEEDKEKAYLYDYTIIEAEVE